MINDSNGNPEQISHPPAIGTLIEARLNRRQALRGLATSVVAIAGAASITGCAGAAEPTPGEEPAVGAPKSSLTFQEVPHGIDDTHRTAQGYSAQIVVRWGDPVVAGAQDFNVAQLTADAQSKQFGYNNDFIAFMPLPRGSSNSEHGLLCVNHEYTVGQLMFSGFKDKPDAAKNMSAEQVAVEMAAHGLSVVEIKRDAQGWQRVPDSKYSRRITANSEFRIAGPAAGDDRMKTSVDSRGTRVFGTLNNCAGGFTPWGTVLSGEENFDGYFFGKPAEATNPQIIEREAKNQKRFAIGRDDYAWHRFHDRFRVDREPRESNRFGWVVEYDPYDPNSIPVKRTALGRFKHEGATCTLTADNRVVVYSGDDSRGDYLYKFVSHGRFDPAHRERNLDLLDSGTLYVAQFKANGNLHWLPLVYGSGPLTGANGFRSQADVLIDTRLAADLLRATPLDRPEDVEVNPITGRVFVMLTNNSARKEPNAANPRPANKHGHILELIPPSRDSHIDHGSDVFRWEIFLLAGNPRVADDKAQYHDDVSADGWLSCPDNCAFDSEGRLWIATDGAPGAAKFADAVYACDTNGPGRALTRQFFRAPTGAEMCGPCFTPDGTTFFVSVQHPGDEEDETLKVRSTFDKPSTRWPDFDEKLPPRPAVVAITREGGGRIGE